MVVEQGSRIVPVLGAGAIIRRHGSAVALAVLLVACLCAASSLLFAWIGGVQTYVTNPASAFALAGSAGGIGALGSRRFALRDRTGGVLLFAVAASVAACLVLGAAATVTASAIAISVWSVWWAVPLVVIQLAAMNASSLRARWAVAFSVIAIAALITGAVFAQPTAPFVGLAPIAPDGWPASPVLDVLTTGLFAATIAVPVALLARALRDDRAVRPTSLVVASAAAVPPLLIVVCYGLAVARDPGAVEPAVGSVAYLVTLSSGCLLAAACLALVRPMATASTIVRLVAVVLAGYAAVVVALAATWIGSLLQSAGPLVSGIAVAALAIGVAIGWWSILNLVSGWLAQRDTPTASARLAILSAREREVLELLADGVRDADIAARLHLSPRTVESHLTRIFAKLGLDSADGRNRRVLAVRAWSEADAGS